MNLLTFVSPRQWGEKKRQAAAMASAHSIALEIADQKAYVLENKLKTAQGEARRFRSYKAALSNRLVEDWRASNQSANEEIRAGGPRLVRRSRESERNDEYMTRFIHLSVVNIWGFNGVKFKARSRRNNGELDTLDNEAIETGRREWSKVCNVDRVSTFSDTMKLLIRAWVRDGEGFIRLIKGWRGNKFRLGLFNFESDLVDWDLNARNKDNGNRIVMGVEIDVWGAPVAYWLFMSHPGEAQRVQGRRRIRVPANEIIHLFIRQRAGQIRGVPMAHASMNGMHMLAGYREAEVVAARAEASKFSVWEVPEEYDGDLVDETETPIDEYDPGSIGISPPGWKLHDVDPNHPTAQHGAFIKTQLRGIASGMGVSYAALANDLESVSFGSLRSGINEERDNWREKQSVLIEQALDPIHDAFIEAGLLAGAFVNAAGITLPFSRIEKFLARAWHPRTWPWIDPLKDVQAASISRNHGFKSTGKIIAESSGQDTKEVFEEIAEDEKLADDLGINISNDKEEILTENGRDNEDD